MLPSSKSIQRIVWMGFTFALTMALAASPQLVRGEEGESSEPVHHVAQQGQPAQPAAPQPAAAPVAAAPAAANPQAPFDLTQRQGEHPLMPLIRVLQGSLQHIDQNVRDYSCTLVKRERIDGTLGDPQYIFMKVLHQPFSVYMSFIQPHSGREVVFVNGQNNNELLVLDGGWKRRALGVMKLDPQGMVAMRGQKYPITSVGFRNLTAEILQIAQKDTQFGECTVEVNPNTNIGGRPTTLVQIVHPVPRQNFRAHIARIFLDNELKVPIHYDGYLWPENQGEQPPLDESYTYTNLKLNNGLMPREFDPNQNPQIFQVGRANLGGANVGGGR
jgi:hypothetical protein